MAALFDLDGKVALVTGATGGLGSSIVEHLAAYGATVLLSDLPGAPCEQMAQRLRDAGRSAHALACDVSCRENVDELAAAALRIRGRLDLLVCNAGVQGPAGPIGASSDEHWRQVMDTNLRSALWLTTAVMPSMAQHGGGSVVLMSSIAGIRGNKALGLYSLSKAALAQLARNLAVEWGPRNVRVNAVSPGLIRHAAFDRAAGRRGVHAAPPLADAAAARGRSGRDRRRGGDAGEPRRRFHHGA